MSLASPDPTLFPFDFLAPPPAVPGLVQRDALIAPEEENALIAAIDAAGLAPFRFQGWLGKRLTASFGWSYDFDRGRFEAAEPIPDWLEPIRLRAAAFAGLAPDALVQALLIRYDPGAGIGWHRDRPVFDRVVGISLGHPATLRLRRRTAAGFDRAAALLVPRAAYLLSGEVRRDWEHSIAPLAEPRWSITFRSLADHGLARR
ncbi:alpha-ketoglutarate-dependent dioxygenase AlkB [Flavisphingomonas formosensis]|uniref:alpha-ketoglutarate-dependent dioxygenase AlkB n=1 Tax=Flavisphingomonas formosensis TaxID=861534 RepID=UPI0012F833CF|nr:alpha-ketoglutarate-dependent dioxygenase AlkB [Sphingomonas formosensis]